METETIPLIYAGKIDEAKGILLGIQDERNDKMRPIADALVDEAKERARTATIQSEHRANRSARIFATVGALALLISAMMAVFLSRLIANPLKEISGVAARVASGDLTVTISVDHRADEIGTLRQTFHSMAENLCEVTGEQGAA